MKLVLLRVYEFIEEIIWDDGADQFIENLKRVNDFKNNIL
jgi:hypothetical protein